MRRAVAIVLAAMLVSCAAQVAGGAEGAATSAARSVGSEGPSAPASGERNDDWQVLGWGGGGAQFMPTVSPHDPKIALVRCDMTGMYITKDGGESWRMINLRTTADFFVFDPVDPKVIYIGAMGLYRSSDGGDTWELVYPDPARVKGINVNGDHAQWEWVLDGGETKMSDVPGAAIEKAAAAAPMQALAVDPEDSKTLYAAIGAKVMRSTDYAKTWSPIGDARGCMGIYVDPKSPRDDRTVYVIEAARVLVREKGAWKARAGPQGTRFSSVSGGFPKEGGALAIYATSWARWQGERLVGGIWVSSDGGETWTNPTGDFAKAAMKPGPAPAFATIATCIKDPSVAVVSFENLRFGPSWEHRTMGVGRTLDGGKTWAPAVKDTPAKASPNTEDAWNNVYFSPAWGDNPIGLGIAPGDTNVVYGTDDGRTMRTHDGFETWKAAYSAKRGSGWTSRGLDVTGTYGVFRDPFAANRVFLPSTDVGMWRSEDGGTTWVHSMTGAPDAWGNTVYWIVFDPEVKGRAWGGASGIHDLPRPKMWRDREVSGYDGGVMASEDGGKTWRKSNGGMKETPVTHLVMDPKSPKERRTLYACGFGTGVWKSVDGGRSWRAANKGLTDREPFAWRLAMDGEGTLWLIVARRSEDGSYGNAQDGKLYRSKDGAETWERMALPEDVNGPNGLHIDPRDAKRMWLACWGRVNTKGGNALGGGIYETTDGGETWKRVFDRNLYVYDVTADPSNPDVLYASGFESSAWRSGDGGSTWKRIRGYNFKWGYRVVPDTENPGKIFVTTFGGGVWYGPAEGDADAPEDIVTEGIRYQDLER